MLARMPCGCKKRNQWTVLVNGEPTDRAFPTRSAAERYALKVGGKVVQR
jgi:hypothetical protein